MFSHARSFWFACLQTRPIIRPYLFLFEVPHFYLYISLCIVNAKRKHYSIAALQNWTNERLLPRNISAVFCLSALCRTRIKPFYSTVESLQKEVMKLLTWGIWTNYFYIARNIYFFQPIIKLSSLHINVIVLLN